MSAFVVTDINTEQLASRGVSPNHRVDTDGSFAQSFNQRIETNLGARSKPLSADAINLKKAIPSRAQESTGNIAKSSLACLQAKVSPGRGEASKGELIPTPSNSAAASGTSQDFHLVQPDKVENTLGGCYPGDSEFDDNEFPEINPPNSTSPGANISSAGTLLFPANRSDSGLLKSDNDSKPTAAAVKPARPQQNMDVSQGRKTVAIHPKSLPIIPAMVAADNSFITDASHCSIVFPDKPQIQSGQASEMAAAAGPASKTSFQSKTGGDKSSRLFLKDGSREVRVANSEIQVNTPTKQDPAEKPQAETEKGMANSLSDGPPVSDSKTEGFATGLISSNFEINHVSLASTPGFVPEPHLAISKSETGSQQHPADPDTHATDSATRSDGLGMTGSASMSVNGLPKVLNATPAVLEVGIESDTHGWLKVRAELTETGAVNASIAATSLASQSILHRELPGLTTYLQQEKVAVNLTIAPPHAILGPDSRTSTAAGDGSAGQAQQGSDREGRKEQRLERIVTEAIGGTKMYESWRSGDEDGLLSTLSHSKGSSWLSVRA